jgi:cytochrome P450
MWAEQVRGPEAPRARACYFRQQGPGPGQVFVEQCQRFSVIAGQVVMFVAVEADLVSRRGYRTHDIGMLFHHPPDHKEHRVRIVFRQFGKNTVRALVQVKGQIAGHPISTLKVKAH